MKNKLISILLAICSICLLAGLVGCRENDSLNFSNYDEGVQLVSAKGQEEVYEIPSQMGRKTVVKIGNGAFEIGT